MPCMLVAKYLTFFTITHALCVASLPWTFLTKLIAPCSEDDFFVSREHKRSWHPKMRVVPSICISACGEPKFTGASELISVGVLNFAQRI